MKKIRFTAAILLAFGSLLLAQPSEASEWQGVNARVSNGSVQFDYRGGSASQTLTAPAGSVLTVTIDNTIANCIGVCAPRPDTWSLTINGQSWSGNSIGIAVVSTDVSGDVTLVATGKDEGFWGGWYGPTFSAPVITSPEPEPVAETGTWEGQVFSATAPEGEVFTAVTGWYGAPNDQSCGADVSAILATYLGGNTFTVGSDNGVFGDPCGGVVKVLRVNLTSTVAPVQIEPTPTPTPTPAETPATSSDTGPDPVVPEQSQPSQPEPSPTPTVPPVVTPPAIEPAPQPQPIPFPVEPTPEPAQPPLPTEPTMPPTEESEPEPTRPVDTPLETVEQSEPTNIEEPHVEEQQLQKEPLPIQPPVETIEEHSITVIENISELEPESLSNVQIALLQAATNAVFETAEQGSPAYEQALQALAVIAQADDVELPAELAAIPLLGDAAGAALEAFNAIGNIGADMSPAVREQAEEAVVASVIVGQVATSAAVAAVSASTSTASIRKIK